MTTYKETFGKQIKQVSSDPTDAGAEGQIWFNTTAGVFKTVVAVGAWSSGGNLSTARKGLGGAGTQTAGLAFGGSTDPDTNSTEEYDGSGWTAGGNLISAVANLAGCGLQTAALKFGGNPRPSNGVATEGYDGTSWSTRPSMATARADLTGAGTNVAALAIGGYTGSNSALTEEFTGETTAANIKTFTTS